MTVNHQYRAFLLTAFVDRRRLIIHGHVLVGNSPSCLPSQNYFVLAGFLLLVLLYYLLLLMRLVLLVASSQLLSLELLQLSFFQLEHLKL